MQVKEGGEGKVLEAEQNTKFLLPIVPWALYTSPGGRYGNEEGRLAQ